MGMAPGRCSSRVRSWEHAFHTAWLDARLCPAFSAGRSFGGCSLFSSFRITPSDQLHARYDQFNGDPVSGQNVRAFNIGYLWRIREKSRFAIGYQFKNKASFNDDLLNTKLQIRDIHLR